MKRATPSGSPFFSSVYCDPSALGLFQPVHDAKQLHSARRRALVGRFPPGPRSHRHLDLRCRLRQRQAEMLAKLFQVSACHFDILTKPAAPSLAAPFRVPPHPASPRRPRRVCLSAPVHNAPIPNSACRSCPNQSTSAMPHRAPRRHTRPCEAVPHPAEPCLVSLVRPRLTRDPLAQQRKPRLDVLDFGLERKCDCQFTRPPQVRRSAAELLHQHLAGQFLIGPD